MHHVGDEHYIMARRNRILEEIPFYNLNLARSRIAGQVLTCDGSGRGQLEQRAL